MADLTEAALATLIREAAAGSAAARSALVERHGGEVFRHLVFLTGDPVWAEDLAQETWIRALEHLGKLKEAGAFRPWILRIAGNEFRMGLRRRKEQALDPGAVERALGGRDGATLEILETLQALRGLEPDFREALILVDVQGFSYGEAAGIIGISEGALRSRLHRARRKFDSAE